MEIVILVIVIIVIRSRMLKAKEAADRSLGKNPPVPPAPPIKVTPIQTNDVSYPSRPVAPSSSTARPVSSTKNATSNVNGATAIGKNGNAGKTPEENIPKEKSTTELLREKAQLDEKEHVKEKYQQKAEEKKHYGDLRYAGRYLLGDEVPRGMRIVKCDYCGAENLLKNGDYASRYNCYFCRERLM